MHSKSSPVKHEEGPESCEREKGKAMDRQVVNPFQGDEHIMEPLFFIYLLRKGY